MADYVEIKCNNSEHIFKISNEDNDSILLGYTWYFWKGGKKGGGYICSRPPKSDRTIYLHHLIMERTGIPKPTPNHSIDHINRDKLDNRRSNLRWATQSEQNENTGKRNRKYNAKPLPEGITHDMLPKYVVYYEECYNKEKDLHRNYFKIEKHPDHPKIIIGSKSNKLTIHEKLEQIKQKLEDIYHKPETNQDGDDEITKLMKCLPKGISYKRKDDKRSEGYIIETCNYNGTGKRKSKQFRDGNKTLRENFINVYDTWKEWNSKVIPALI
jgi:hypothetical protein